jgi:AraC-like DNA-binding protein
MHVAISPVLLGSGEQHQILKEGRAVKSVAATLGYRSSATFTRVLGQGQGISPSIWIVHYYHAIFRRSIRRPPATAGAIIESSNGR